MRSHGAALWWWGGAPTRSLRALDGVGCRRGTPRAAYLTFFPAITVPSLPALEFAVASTFGTSFLGFLASLPPLFFSFDISGFLFADGSEAAHATRDRCPRFCPFFKGNPGKHQGRHSALCAEVGACERKMGERGGEGKGGVGVKGQTAFHPKVPYLTTA